MADPITNASAGSDVAAGGAGDYTSSAAGSMPSPTTAPGLAPAMTAPAPPAPGASPQPSITASNPAPPPPPGTLLNRLSHAFMGAVLGGLAGKQEVDRYEQDPATGKVTPVLRDLHPRDQLAKIARNALTGLAAGSVAGAKEGPTSSGLAKGLTGLGAGAEENITRTQSQDLLKRKQFEEDQQAILRKGEIAKGNALNHSIYFGNLRTLNDMTPMYASNQALVNSAKESPELQGHVRELSDKEIQNEINNDPNFISSHIIRPLGWAPVVDERGNPVTNLDGTVQRYMRMGVIDGTQDGMMPVTPELAASIKQYGSSIPNSGDIKVGQKIPMERMIPLINALDAKQRDVIDGWHKSTVGLSPDGKTLLEINGNDKSITRPLEGISAKDEDELAKMDLTKAQAEEARGKATESLANAAMLRSNLPNADPNSPYLSLPGVQEAIKNLSPEAQAVIRTVDPRNIESLIKAADGDINAKDAFPQRGYPKAPWQLEYDKAVPLIEIFNGQWSAYLFDIKKDLMLKFAAGPERQNINSFNQFMVHTAEMLDISSKVQRTNSPLMNEPLNVLSSKYMGEPGIPELMTAIQASRQEWQNFLASGYSPKQEDAASAKTLMDDTKNPSQILGAARIMSSQAVGRLDQLNEEWKTPLGYDYPNLITPTGREAAGKIGVNVSKYKTGGTLPGATGVIGAPPAGVTPAQQQQSINQNKQNQSTINQDEVLQRYQNALKAGKVPKGTTGIGPKNPDDGNLYYHDIKGTILGKLE